MICQNCSEESRHIRIYPNGRIGCHNCMGFSETGGSPTDRILTRNASRITEEQLQHEGDMQPPYVVDKTTKQVVVNEDFISLYPDQAAQTYTAEELRSVGQEGLATPVNADDGKGIEYTGDANQAINDIIQA